MVERGTALAEPGVAALQITPVHYLFRPDDDAMLDFYRAATDQTGLPVISYNVVPWSYLAPEMLCRILSDVPGVIEVKQSAADMKLLADLLREAPAGSLILSAVDALLYPSFALGAHGAVVWRWRVRRSSARRRPPASPCRMRSRAATSSAPSTCTAGCWRCGTPSPATTCRPA